MRTHLSFTIILLFLIFVPFVTAQQEQSVQIIFEKDIDAQMRDIEIQVFRKQALEGDRDVKLNVLVSIQDKIDNGDKIDNPEMISIIESLTLEGTAGVETRELDALVNYYPMVRRQATRLLGKIGNPISIPTLLTTLLRDSDNMIRAEAAYALGAIGSDDQAVLDSLSLAARRIDPVTPHNELATAILVAVEDIAEENGGVFDPLIMTALVQIATGNYYRQVREKALDVLKGLRKFR